MILNRNQQILFFIALVVVLVFCTYQASKLSYSYKFADFFPKNDPDIQFYDSAKSQFSHGDELIIIGIQHTSSVFSGNFLNKIDSFETAIKSIQGVTKTSSLISLKNYIKTLTGIRETPFIDLNNADRLKRDTTQFFQYPDVHPKFISPDRKSTCIYVTIDDKLPDGFSDRLNEVIKAQGFYKHYTYGYQLAEDEFENKLKTEIITLTIVGLILITACVYSFYRSFSILLISGIFIGVSVLITLGFLATIGGNLNLLTVSTPSIIAIISMSDLIHVFTRFNEEEIDSKLERLKLTYSDLNRSLLLTSLTTSIGFLSLVFTGVLPFIQFGLVVSFGIFVAYILTLLLLPELIRLLSKKQPQTTKATNRLLKKTSEIVSRKPGIITVFATLLLICFSYLGMQNEVDAYIYEDLDSDDPLSESLEFFESNFFGIRDLNLFITIQEPYDLLDQEILLKLNEIETFIEDSLDVRSAYGFATLAKRYNRIHYRGSPDRFVVPEREDVRNRLIDEFRNFEPKSVLHAVITPDHRFTQIMVKSNDWGSKVNNQKIAVLQRFLGSHIDQSQMQVRISGESIFLDRSNENITRYLFYSLLGAFGVIFIILILTTRSFKIALIGLGVNILPIVMLLGLLMILGITLNKSTAVVFTIAFGIAVDDSIHFITRFHTALKRKKPFQQAIEIATNSTGKAIIITSLILIGGFGTMIFSSFQSTATTGLLISASLFLALLADLIVLPSLLHFSNRKD